MQILDLNMDTPNNVQIVDDVSELQEEVLVQVITGIRVNSATAADLRFGDKVYDGTKTQVILAEDLDALTHQSIAEEKILGGIKVGYVEQPNIRIYGVRVDNKGNAYVDVPWTDFVTVEDTDIIIE